MEISRNEYDLLISVAENSLLALESIATSLQEINAVISQMDD